MLDALREAARLCVPVFVVSSMLAMGLALTPRALVAPLKSPRLMASALFVNFVVSPALAYALTAVFPIERPYAVGLLLLSTAAGAPFLPKLAEAAHADPPLSVAVMGLLTAGTVLFMPLALPVLVPGFRADGWTIARPLLLMMVLPLAVGMLVRRGPARLAAACRPVLNGISNVSLIVLLGLVIGLNGGALLDVAGSGALAVSVAFAVLVFVAGYLSGGPDPQGKAVLGLAAAARNVGAALPVAGLQRDPEVVVMLLVATLAGLFVSLMAAGFLRRRVIIAARPEDSPPAVGVVPQGGAGVGRNAEDNGMSSPRR